MWAREADRARVYVRADGSLAGYGYLTADAWISPAIGVDERLVAAAIRDLLGEYAGDFARVVVPISGTAREMLPVLLRAGMRSEEGAKLLYCSNGAVPPPQYLMYGGYLP